MGWPPAKCAWLRETGRCAFAQSFQEPTHPRPLRGGEQAFVRVVPVPLLGGVSGGFMVPMHAKKRKRAFQEPRFLARRPPRPRSGGLTSRTSLLRRESGAKDERTPNADASSADSAGSAKRLECVRFIGA